MAKTVIHDTADVIITNKETGQVVINAEAQTAGLTQSVEETPIYAGIGNKKIYVIRSQKELELTISSALFDLEYLAMTQGVSIEEDGTATVTKYKTATVSGGEVAINVTPKNDTVRIIGPSGSQAEVTLTDGTIIVPEGIAADGDQVTVVYLEDVTGRKVSIDSEKFASKYKIEYRTIEYDPVTATVVADIYFIFDEAIPSGAFDISLTNGEAYAPELTFQVMVPQGATEMGRMIEVPRK